MCVVKLLKWVVIFMVTRRHTHTHTHTHTHLALIVAKTAIEGKSAEGGEETNASKGRVPSFTV
jgi:hypothetical protein